MSSKPYRYFVEKDGTQFTRFDRAYAVVDTESIGWDGKPVPVYQTNSAARAVAEADQRNYS